MPGGAKIGLVRATLHLQLLSKVNHRKCRSHPAEVARQADGHTGNEPGPKYHLQTSLIWSEPYAVSLCRGMLEEYFETTGPTAPF
jgi:hypothetical protein